MDKKINDYRILSVLGQGGFGKVYLVESATKEKFAAKVIQINKKIKEDVRKEGALMGGINHKNILRVRQYFFHDSETSFVIICEYCPQGSFDNCIGQIDPSLLKKQLLRIAEGVQHLHNYHRIVHRDLKPENILMKQNEPMIADLGISRVVDSSGASTQIGTQFYMAPEMMEDNKYSFSVDVWALGIIFMEAIIGQRIYELLPGRRAPCDREGFPEDLIGKISDQTMKKLVKNMLIRNPASRCSINEVVQALGGSKVGARKGQEPVKQQKYSAEELEYILQKGKSAVWSQNAWRDGIKKALPYFKQLFDLNHPEGIYEYCYWMGSSEMQENWFEFDYEEEWIPHFRKAAELGSRNAMFMLGDYERAERGDVNEQLRYFLKAQKMEGPLRINDNEPGKLELMIGHAYRQKKDYGNATKWYKLSTSMGNVNGEYHIRTLYE